MGDQSRLARSLATKARPPIPNNAPKEGSGTTCDEKEKESKMSPMLFGPAATAIESVSTWPPTPAGSDAPKRV